MKRVELLSPAGDLEKLKIAILYGADAVFVGGKEFSLRSQASNFSIEDIKEGVAVGVQMGTTADFYCGDLGCEVKQYNKYAEAVMELKNEKIACIVMDSLPAEQLVAANEELEILDAELFTDKYAIAVQKGNTELLEQMNEVLQTLVDEGKVDEFTINHTTK